MKSPLQADKDLIKEFDIDEASDLQSVFKLGYVRAQIDEFKKAMYRNRVDALISMDLMDRAQKAKDEALEAKAKENLMNYRNFIKQTAGALKFLEQLVNELAAITPSTQPEQ